MSHFERKPSPLPDDLQQHVKGILGLGTLPSDGETRISKGSFFSLFQGNEEAHEAMLTLCMSLQKELSERDINVDELTKGELIEIMESL